ncbi:MAG TPA: ZIP family metal transporter [Firmicutes bacterium]|jgi:ZIP family zinc transporter|nr:ZIP family metal transporter [Bacillota bacterium]HCX69744.1 ZIP family metal transporter [Bacillota bacterium]
MALAVIGAALMGFMIGLAGTATGGLFVLSFQRPSHRTQTLLIGFSGGVMLAVVFFDLIPESWQAGGWAACLIGTLTGVALIRLLDQGLTSLSRNRTRRLSRYTRTGLLLGLGIALHNFPEGVALGTVYTASTNPGGWIGLALLMALHNIPEGMVMAAAMRLGNIRIRKVIWALVLVELPMGVGAALGGFFGELSALSTSLSLAFAGGAMLYITLDELFPAASELGGWFWMTVGTAGGGLVGAALTRIVQAAG